MRITREAIANAKEILEWARTAGNHGGNPYCQDHVKRAEHILAISEGRKPADWAGGRSWEKFLRIQQ